MKLLIVTNLFPNSAEPNRGIFNKQQFVELSKYCEIKVVAPIPWHKLRQVPLREEIDGFDVYHPRYFMTPKIGRSLYGIFFFLGIIGTMMKLKDSFRYDAILATWAYPDGFGAALAARLLNKPLFMKVHGSDVNEATKYFIRRKMIKFAVNVSEKVVAVSDQLKHTLVSIGVDDSKEVVIKNGVDNELFKEMDKIECRKKTGVSDGDNIIAYVGNLKRNKGLNVLMEAMSRLDEGCRLILIGEGTHKTSLKALAESLHIEGRVDFIGSKPHSEIPIWMNAADVVCLPSLNEGCPNVVIEALSCGVPVVATRVGGVPDIVRSDSQGILVEPSDPGQLSAGLRKALDKEWDRAHIRSSVAEYDWIDNGRKLADILMRRS